MQPQRYSGHERRARDRSQGIRLRRRLKDPVETERRRPIEGTAEVAAALELHLDQCRTRRAMLTLIETWLGEARNAPPDAQDPVYARALERSIEVIREAPDLETGIAVLQRQD
jgi:hypothetical protein